MGAVERFGWWRVLSIGCAAIALTLCWPRAYAANRDSIPNEDSIHCGGATLKVDYPDAPMRVTHAQMRAWVMRAARAVDVYYGRYPVPSVRIRIVAAAGDRVVTGSTYGDDMAQPLIHVSLGRDADNAALQSDWVMTHEMVHLSIPSLQRRHHWFEEGVATYVEPIARVQAGQLKAAKIWADMMHGMPYGLPHAGDEGLDRTHTWGRTYWGGAMFCLLADVEIRQRTHGRKGLQDALRGVLAAGGSIRQEWPMHKLLTVADQAIGQPVLAELYARMGDAPMPMNLPALWRRLGVTRIGSGVSFNDSAPLAAVRLIITRREGARGEGAEGQPPPA